MQIWLYTQLGLNILLIRVQIKSHLFHFQILKVTKMKELHVKERLYIIFYNMKEMSEFCKSVKLGWFKKKTNCNRLCATLYTIQLMLVHKNASNYGKMCKKMIRRFYDTIK